MWLARFVGTIAALACIRLIHVGVSKAMPDSKLKRALLKERRLPGTTPETPAGQAIATEDRSMGYLRRSALLTWRDPHFRRGVSVLAAALGPALVAGLAYGLYLVLSWLKIVG
jgi:hypothetical protein